MAAIALCRSARAERARLAGLVRAVKADATTVADDAVGGNIAAVVDHTLHQLTGRAGRQRDVASVRLNQALIVDQGFYIGCGQIDTDQIVAGDIERPWNRASQESHL